MRERMPIGRVLVERGVASLAAVEEAALAARASDSRLCSKLLDAGTCDEGELATVLAEVHGIPGVDLSRTVVDLATLDAVPQAVAEADLILPLSTEGGRLHLAVASPECAERVVSEVRFVTGREVCCYVVVLSALRGAIAACYRAKAQDVAVWRGHSVPHEAPPRIAVCIPRGESSEKEGGTTPPPPDEGVLEDLDIVDASEEQVLLSVAVNAGPRRVLVVDDEPAIRLLAQRALEHRGFVVDTAGDGLEALDEVRRRLPDLVLLDAMLPKLHGFEVARRLRSDGPTRTLPIIIMTAVYRGWRFAQDARESFGAQDYVEKPFRVDDLLRRVEAVLEASKAHVPGAAAPLVVAGRAALEDGRLDEALAEFEQAVRVDPFSAEALMGLGEALRARGDVFRAMSAFERAVELRPGLLNALRILATLYLTKGFRAKAAEVLERAVHVAADPRTREQLRRELLQLL
jgi:DNA-binding response OmpR family regulator